MSDNIERCCDLVMKGGITSGVVYPKVVEQVAKRFHLVGVSGTSAGAIAASLAAAAEYRRRTTGSFEGFAELGRLADELARAGRLFELFTPDRETEKSFRLLRRVLEDGLSLSVVSKLLLRRRKYLQPLIDNAYGLCTGMANGRPGADPLTPWLARSIDRIAGRSEGEPPLTFRDLHEAPLPPQLETMVGPPETRRAGFRAIDFRAVTTCITFGRPYEFPLDTNIFAFDPETWRRYFPAYVVDHLVARGEEIVTATDGSSRAEDGKLPLTNADLPIVVATRMSLSFPVLLTMVPLWAIDYRTDEPRRLEPVWFSDGGLTSNFPLHRFDGLYPQWPTLGVTLASGSPDHPRLRKAGEESPGSPESLVYLPGRPGDGRGQRWNRFEEPGGNATGSLVRFLLALFSASQNWHDESFLTLPGYRGRSVEIWMSEGEGGLNLEMKPEVVRRLVERGAYAGEQIAQRFHSDDPADRMGWDAHRWTRFRSGMRAFVDELEDLNRSVNAVPMAGGVPLADWLSGAAKPPVHAHRKSERQRDEAAFQALIRLAANLLGDPRPFSDGPKPAREFATRPPMDR